MKRAIRVVLVAAACVGLARIPGPGSVRADEPTNEKPDALYLLGSPMIGAVTHDSVRIWLRGSVPTSAYVRAWVYGEKSKSRGVRSRTIRLNVSTDMSGVVELHDLKPDTVYTYSIVLNGYAVRNRLWRFRTPPLPGTRGKVRIAVSGCAKIDDPGEFVAWDAIRNSDADFFFGNGDLPYADAHLEERALIWWKARSAYFSSPTEANSHVLKLAENAFRRAAPERISIAWQELRTTPGWSALAASTPMIFGWDDHDSGINDADASNPVLVTALEIFERYTANPAMGTPWTPGVFFTYGYGDVELFVLDDVTYRTPDLPRIDDQGRQLLGTDQVAWLKESLLASKATFKLISTGSAWNEGAGKRDAWRRAPNARRELVDFVFQKKIPGVVLLGGDVHRVEVHKHESFQSEGVEGYPLYEIVASCLHRAAKKVPKQTPGRLFAEGSDSRETRSLFALLDIDTRNKGEETLTVRVIDAAAEGKAQKLYELTIRASELSFEE